MQDSMISMQIKRTFDQLFNKLRTKLDIRFKYNILEQSSRQKEIIRLKINEQSRYATIPFNPTNTKVFIRYRLRNNTRKKKVTGLGYKINAIVSNSQVYVSKKV